jgi:hypothetical protein
LPEPFAGKDNEEDIAPENQDNTIDNDDNDDCDDDETSIR